MEESATLGDDGREEEEEARRGDVCGLRKMAGGAMLVSRARWRAMRCGRCDAGEVESLFEVAGVVWWRLFWSKITIAKEKRLFEDHSPFNHTYSL